jgi:diguanylate cyclase (GGDEF)-like protein
MKKSLTFALVGFSIGLGAPLGAFYILWGRVGYIPPFQDFFAIQWDQYHFFYEYMMIGTSTVFSAFGYVLGRYADQIRSKNRRLLLESQTDPLTGLGNHRYLHEAFHHQYQNRKSDSEPISCLMMDLDFFKKVNDTFGHPFGDEVLRVFAHVIKKTIRPGDIAARYGGEEFVCILPNCNKEEAVKVAERVRETMANHTVFFKKTPVKITVSVGAATEAGISANYHELVRLADKALYQAKESGRNKVIAV